MITLPAKFLVRRRLVIAAWTVAAVIFAPRAARVEQALEVRGGSTQVTEAVRASELLRNAFPSPFSEYVAIVVRGPVASSAERFAIVLDSLTAAVERRPYISQVVSLSSIAGSTFVSRDPHATFLIAALRPELADEVTNNFVPNLRETVRQTVREAIRWVQEAQRRGIRKVALLTQDYPSIHGHVQAVKAEVARVGLPITYAQEFADSVTDFRSMIAQARASNPDVYFVEALSPQLELLGQQLFEAKIRNIASVVAPSVTQRPELFEGAWYTDSDLRDIGFKQRFEKQYPGTRFATHMMPYAYDDFNMIVQAFERGENPAVYIRNIATYDGTAGPLTKAPGSGTFQSRPAVWVIQNGKPALLSLR